jgi:hypothetical protein
VYSDQLQCFVRTDKHTVILSVSTC